MYLELFKLQELPFRLSPDPAFLYLSKHHARAKAYMESTIWFTDGFVVITGEVGSGKTTLIETFLRELEKDVLVAQINQTQVSASEFLQAVLAQFGFKPFKMKKAELLNTLNNFLIEQYAAGRKVMLIVDEAQNLSNKVLEEIRLLSGVETTKEKVLRIILAGQPELNDKLNSQGLVQLVQRVRLRFHLTPLSKSDTRAYIEHRLEVAGSHGRKIFAKDTFPVVYRYTGGVPRLVNTLCDTAMMTAYAGDKDTVDVEELLQAVEELQWPEFTARTNSFPAPGELKDDAERLPPPRERAPLRHSEEPVALVLLAHEGQSTTEMPLYAGRRIIIGRTGDNDLQIDSKFISRHHCQIITSAGSCVIEDLNSTNGIYIKAKRVRKHNLNDGDVVLIGKHELMYIDERTRSRRDIEPIETSTAASDETPEPSETAG
jgi:type II secretory pathway predicted ATPase ExeA